jgi:nucleotide-sensitive chloride channel 1A
MAMEITSEIPTVESFIPLSEHQSQTPGTFFGGRPVLHYHSLGAKLLISKSQYDQFAALHELKNANGQNGSSEQQNGASSGDVTITGVDAWVTSR